MNHDKILLLLLDRPICSCMASIKYQPAKMAGIINRTYSDS